MRRLRHRPWLFRRRLWGDHWHVVGEHVQKLPYPSGTKGRLHHREGRVLNLPAKVLIQIFLPFELLLFVAFYFKKTISHFKSKGTISKGQYSSLTIPFLLLSLEKLLKEDYITEYYGHSSISPYWSKQTIRLFWLCPLSTQFLYLYDIYNCIWHVTVFGSQYFCMF